MSKVSARRRWLLTAALVMLGLGGSLGFGLSSLGLLPIPDVTVGWTVPLPSSGDYVPSGSARPGEEIVLVYVGSSTCPWSNLPELPGLVRAMKSDFDSRVLKRGKSFVTLGIARDRLAADGLEHLAKFGAFDEVMAGSSWANTGIQHFVYGDREIAGPAATPQVVLLSRRLADPSGHLSIEDERVLLRKTGFEAIREWAANGLPVPELDREWSSK